MASAMSSAAGAKGVSLLAAGHAQTVGQISVSGYRRDIQRQRMISAALVTPLVAFIVLAFVLPLGSMLFFAINNPEVRQAMPKTIAALDRWDGVSDVPTGAYEALIDDIRAPVPPNVMAEAGRRLNYEITGFRSVLAKTVRAVKAASARPDASVILSLDKAWGDKAYWRTIKRNSTALTPFYLLAALDLRVQSDGTVGLAPPEERLFLSTLLRTLVISGTVTVICLLIGYPVANAIVSIPGRFSSVMLACVLLPFWTSLLVRTSAWIVILQKEGLINGALRWLGVIDSPLELVFNRTGLYIAMVHILLPFMVLPLVSIMKGVPASYTRASSSLGARPLTTFFRVYLPLTLPGVGAGCLLTFIIAAGYYVTPTLVGGASDQMLSYFVAFYANTTINWGMSAALGFLLLTCILALYILVGRFIGIGRIVGMN